MKRIRHIGAIWKQNDVVDLANFGIKIDEGYDYFNIEENENYQKIKSTILNRNREVLSDKITGYHPENNPNQKRDLFDRLAVVRFDKKEIKKASYYSFFLKSFGYPQPDKDFDYQERVYEFSCPVVSNQGCCGFSDRQKDSFYISKVPRFNSKNLLFSLNWEPDVVLIQKEFFSTFFEPRGYRSIPVFKKLGKEEAKDVVQLKIPICKSPLDLSDSWYSDTGSVCKCCGTVRYSNQTCDFLPPFKNDMNQELCLSQEIFGSGGSSFRRIIISKNFFSELSQHFSYPERSLMPSEN
ncbi:hypothetical protein ACJD0Z_18670 [Flavobacteriaceae bacterium M23B6Z8]